MCACISTIHVIDSAFSFEMYLCTCFNDNQNLDEQHEERTQFETSFTLVVFVFVA